MQGKYIVSCLLHNECSINLSYCYYIALLCFAGSHCITLPHISCPTGLRGVVGLVNLHCLAEPRPMNVLAKVTPFKNISYNHLTFFPKLKTTPYFSVTYM